MVSIIIPNYNYAQFLPDCIKSCINQTCRNIEVIVVDDYSTDESWEMLRKLLLACGCPTGIFRLEKNSGYSVAKNEGIKASHGEWIVTLDADDMLTPKSIEHRMNYATLHPEVDFIYGKCVKFHNESYEYCVKNIDELAKETALERQKKYPHAQGIMVKREVYEKYGMYYEGLRSKADKEFTYRLGVHPDSPIKTNIKKGFVDKYLAFYRRHDGAMHKMRLDNKEYNDEIERIFKERIDALVHSIRKE